MYRITPNVASANAPDYGRILRELFLVLEAIPPAASKTLWGRDSGK